MCGCVDLTICIHLVVAYRKRLMLILAYLHVYFYPAWCSNSCIFLACNTSTSRLSQIPMHLYGKLYFLIHLYFILFYFILFYFIYLFIYFIYLFIFFFSSLPTCISSICLNVIISSSWSFFQLFSSSFISFKNISYLQYNFIFILIDFCCQFLTP